MYKNEILYLVILIVLLTQQTKILADDTNHAAVPGVTDQRRAGAFGVSELWNGHNAEGLS